MTLNLFVLGATGKTGSQVIDLALARGHRVTAFVRSPHKLARRDSALSVIAGDPRSSDELARVLPGHDAVLSAIGPSAREAFRPSTLLRDCATSTVQAMSSAGIRRLAIVSAALLFAERGLTFRFFRWLLREHARDLLAMESIVQASRLDWTIARPPRLVQAAESGYRAQVGAFPAGAPAVMSFRGVAAFLLDSIEDGKLSGRVVGLAPAE